LLLLDQMASKGYHSHYTNTGCSVNGEILLHQSPTPRLGETTCTVPLTGYEPRAILYMSDNSIPQQFERRCGIQDRGVKVAVIGKGDGDTNAIAFRELVCGWQQVKHQLNRLARWDRLQLALEVIVPGQAKVLERGLTRRPM